MKIIFILFFLFLTACGNVRGIGNSQNTVMDTDHQVGVLVGKATDSDYKRVQQGLDNMTKINWAEVKPELAKIEKSPIADRILYLLDNDLITHQTSLMVQCCGGCSVAVPLSCSGCDAICVQNQKGFFDFLNYAQ